MPSVPQCKDRPGQLLTIRSACTAATLYVLLQIPSQPPFPEVGDSMRRPQCLQLVFGCVESPRIKFNSLVGPSAMRMQLQEIWQLAGGAQTFW